MQAAKPIAATLFALFLTLAGVFPTAAETEVYTHVGPTPPPHGYPTIKSVSISTVDVHVGRPVQGSVETSTNVHYVEARINYFNMALHEDAPGKFSLTYTVRWWLPPWLRHGYTLQVIARSIDGVETSRSIPISVH